MVIFIAKFRFRLNVFGFKAQSVCERNRQSRMFLKFTQCAARFSLQGIPFVLVCMQYYSSDNTRSYSKTDFAYEALFICERQILVFSNIL